MVTNGRQAKIDGVSIYNFTTSGTPMLIPTIIGRRDYIKIINNGAENVKLYSSTISGSTGLLIPNSGGTFEDSTNAPLYIASTVSTSVVSIYERKDRK